jgi:arginine decarboxylase
MEAFVPTKVCWTKGVGTHKEDKNARDAASRDAGIGKMNLVQVSSILPPGIEEITLEEFKSLVKPGQIIFSIHGICEGNEPGQKVTMGMGRCIPHDKSKTGFVSERFEEPGIQEDVVKQRVETMAMQIFADENKIDGFKAEDVWEDGKRTYEIGGHKVEVDSLVASGVCNTDGDYTCAIVLALFL